MQGRHTGADKKAHKAKPRAMFFLKHVFIIPTNLHERGHVHFIKRGQHGGGVLRLFQPPRNSLPQAGHFHSLFAHTRFLIGRRNGRNRVSSGRQGIRLGDTTILTGALDRIGI